MVHLSDWLSPGLYWPTLRAWFDHDRLVFSVKVVCHIEQDIAVENSRGLGRE